jgi:hypothetical protein
LWSTLQAKGLKAVITRWNIITGEREEDTVFARHSLVCRDSEIVSVQDVSEEEFNEWMAEHASSMGWTSLTGAT